MENFRLKKKIPANAFGPAGIFAGAVVADPYFRTMAVNG
jgi:hypothetical protein